MRVIHVENQKQFIAVMGVPCGAIHEPKHLSGISHFLEHAMFKSKHVIATMAKNGIIYNAHTGQDYTLFFVTCDAKDCVKAFKILQEIVTSFKLTPADFVKEKRVVIEELALTDGNRTNNVFYQLHKGTPYESGVIGSHSTLDKLQLQDLKNFYDQNYKSISTLVFCHPKWENRLKKIGLGLGLEGSPLHYMNINTNRILNESNTRVIKTSQDHSTGNIGFLGYPASDPKNMTLKFIAYILNGYLIEVIREKLGLVYHVSCLYTAMMHTGYFNIRFYTYSSTAEVLLDLVGKQIKRIQKISREEWDAKKVSFGKRLDSLNSNPNVKTAIAEMESMLYNEHKDTSTINYDLFRTLCKRVFVKSKCAFVIKKLNSKQKRLKLFV